MYQQTPPQALPNKRVLIYQQKPEAMSRNSVINQLQVTTKQRILMYQEKPEAT